VCDGWIGLGEEKWTHVHIWSNGYILYKQDKGRDICLDAAAFRTKVADGLLLEYVAVDVSRKPGRPPASPAPVRLTDRHFPGSYDDKKYKPDCCMHAVLCFERYHNLLHYQL